VLDELYSLILGTLLFGGRITGSLEADGLGKLSSEYLCQLFVTGRDRALRNPNHGFKKVVLDAAIDALDLAISLHIDRVTPAHQKQIYAWLQRRVNFFKNQNNLPQPSSLNASKNQNKMIFSRAEEIAQLSVREQSQALSSLKKGIEANFYLDALPVQFRYGFEQDWLVCTSLHLGERLRSNNTIYKILEQELQFFSKSPLLADCFQNIQGIQQNFIRLLRYPQKYLCLIQAIDFDVQQLRAEMMYPLDSKSLSGDDVDTARMASSDSGLAQTDTQVDRLLDLLDSPSSPTPDRVRPAAIDISTRTSQPQSSAPKINGNSPENNRSTSSESNRSLPQPISGNSPSPREAIVWKCVNTLTAHSDSVVSITYAQQLAERTQRSSYILVSGSWDKTINLWYLGNNGQVHRSPYTLNNRSASVYSVAISPDRQFLAMGCVDYTVRLWHLSHPQSNRILTGHSVPIYSVAFSPDGRFLASGSGDQTVKLWDVSSGELLETLIGHSGFVYSVAFSPDGKILATGSADKTIKLWQVSTRKLLRTLIGNAAVTSVTFSPDGRTLASASRDETIKLWQLETSTLEAGTRPAPTRTLTGHSAEVLCVAVSPRSPILASGSHDKTIKLWHLGSGQLIGTLTGHFDSVNAVAFSPDGQLLTSASHDKTIKIWRMMR